MRATLHLPDADAVSLDVVDDASMATSGDIVCQLVEAARRTSAWARDRDIDAAHYVLQCVASKLFVDRLAVPLRRLRFVRLCMRAGVPVLQLQVQSSANIVVCCHTELCRRRRSPRRLMLTTCCALRTWRNARRWN